MSGQRYRYNKDIANFRNEYMETLGLRANIDDMNLQANKNYKATGALPPQSSMKDTRTTPEILMDTEKLKLGIISDLSPVCSPQMAQLVIQRVMSSPLNGDGSFFIWFAQNTPELSVQLKKKYKYGIAGDSNDAEQMYLFLQSIFSKTKEMNSSVKSAFDRPINNDRINLDVGNFNLLIKQYDDIYFRLINKHYGQLSPQENDLLHYIKQQTDALTSLLNDDAYNKVRNLFLQTSKFANQREQLDINALGYQDWIEYTDKLPSVSSLKTVIDQLNRSTQNSNPELTIKLLTNLSDLIPTTDDTQEISNVFDRIVNSNSLSGSVPPITVTSTPPPVPSSAPARATDRFVVDDGTGNTTSLLADRLRRRSEARSSSSSQDSFISLDDNPFRLTQQERVYCNSIGFDFTDPTKHRALTVTERLYLRKEYSITKQDEDILSDKLSQRVGVGFGFKRRGRPKGSGLVKNISERIDTTQGIKQGHTHVPFGKYIINKNKLDDDIVSFKHMKGYGVKGYPSMKITKNLSRVMKTIVGGGVPKFEELNNLTEDEKKYLHEVSKKAGILDKISIPTPSKDQQEQDVHSFEVMKGEILAGNDSPELIKKFKLLLLKLSRNGSLPKREASEVMEDLISLGY